MKRILLYSVIVLLLLPCITFAQGGQKVLELGGSPSPNQYSARDRVSAKSSAQRGNTKIVGGTRLYCDPNIQVPVDYSSNAGAGFSTSTKTIDQSKSVGSIAGYQGVTGSGGASYTIPLEIPKGTGGVNYPIQLVYNSGAGQGLAGLGWNISGLHLISRSGNNFNDDNNVSPISLSNNDNFSFDGNRLIPDVAANNGKDNTIYHTYMDGFTLTTSHTSDEEKGVDWFEVLTKEGEVMEFGNTADSKVTTLRTFSTATGFVQKTVVNLWYINKITDKNGNYILFDYENKGGKEVVLKSIRYAGNTTLGLSPDKSINFYYDISSFPNTVFVGGGIINSSVLLRKVEMRKKNEILRSYNLTYNKKNTFEFLTNVEEKNAANESFNSTDFSYEIPSTGNTITPVSIGSATNATYGTFISNNKHTLFIDYNGDGYKDVLSFTSDANGDAAVYGFKRDVFGFTQGYGFDKTYSLGLPQNNGDFIFPFLGRNGEGISVSDFNGDGMEDFVLSVIYTDRAGDNKLRITRNIADGYFFGGNQMDIPLSSFISTTQIKTFACEINGDGKTDLVVVRSELNAVAIIEVYLDESTTPNFSKTLNGAYSLEKMIVADIDADGTFEILNLAKIIPPANIGDPFTFEYTDIHFANNSLYDVYRGNTEPYILPSSGCYHGTQPPAAVDVYHYSADFNGDGAADVLKYETATSSWSVDYCFGGIVKINKPANAWMGDPTNCNHDFTLGDVNNDGKTDFIFIEHNFNNTGISYAHIYYSTGTGFFNDNFSLGINFADYDFTFVNTDDMVGGDLMIIGPYNQDKKLYKCNFSEQHGRFGYLKKVANGFNQEVIFNYTNSTDAVNYANTENLAYPYMTIKTPFRLVSNIKTTNGIGGYNTTEYSYENATASRTGKGFLGFKKTGVYDVDLKTKTENEYSLDVFPMLLLQSTKMYNKSSGTVLLSTKTFHNGLDAIWSGAKTTWMVKPLTTPNSSTATDNLAGVTLTTTLTIDDYGNLITKVTDNGIEKVTCNYTFDNSKLYTVPHLLTDELTVAERGGQTNQNRRRSIYTYNAKHLLETKIEKPEPDDNGKAVTTAFEYYATGNLKKKTTSAGGGAKTVFESYEYDANFVNMDKVSNTLSQSTLTTYDAIFDIPKKTTDPSGLVTTYNYDNWQRLVNVTYPNNITTTKKYEWVNSGDVPTGQQVDVSHVIYKITEIAPGKPTVVDYYDGVNRKILSQTQGFSHTLFAGTEYNAKGQRIKSTGAYSTSASIQAPTIATYTYNGRNQLVSETTESGGTQLTTTYSYTYGGGNYTWTANPPDGKKQVKITNGNGEVISTEDNGGTIEHIYSLTANNGRSHITKVGGVEVTTTEFDDAGHQSILIDQAAGTTTYTYNPYGQLVYQKDANQKQYTITYDELGRIETKTGDEGVYTYTYETSSRGLNQLKKIESPGNISYTYTYDNLHRLTKITEQQPDKTFETKYKYDVFGNKTEITYPNNFAITQVYNQQGYLTSIRDKAAGTTIWQGVETNEMGQFTSYVTGNHKSTSRIYNNFGQPLEYNTTGIQQLTFDFNQTTGNLNSRTTNTPNYNYTETFNYSDNLKRLNGWSHTLSSDNFGMSYDDFGRFNNKFDAGNYVYDNQKCIGNKDDNGIDIPLGQQDVAYNEFRKPATIALDGNTLTLTYGCDQERVKGVWTDASAQVYRTRYYATNYEVTEEGLEADRHTYQVAYINAPTGLCAMYVKIDNSAGELYYTYTDYLGSILIVTDKDGNIEADQNFDAWGRNRDPQTLAYTNLVNAPVWLYRGYTGHEMLPEFGLINMNARLYDPVLGLMLSTDNFVQAPNYTQSYNRYTYCFNNPLKYTDPTGNLTWWDAGAAALIVGGVVVGASTGWTGVGLGVGVAMIVAGGTHFAKAAEQSINNGVSWNEASSYSGITVGYTATVAVTTGSKPSPYIDYEKYETPITEYEKYENQQKLQPNISVSNETAVEVESIAQTSDGDYRPIDDPIAFIGGGTQGNGKWASYRVSGDASITVDTYSENDIILIFDLSNNRLIKDIGPGGFADSKTVPIFNNYGSVSMYGGGSVNSGSKMYNIVVIGIKDIPSNQADKFYWQLLDSNSSSRMIDNRDYNKGLGYDNNPIGIIKP